jgi:RNA polymerase primary sigma factor
MKAAGHRRMAPFSELTIYHVDINTAKLLSHQEECELAERIERGDVQARDRMIRANLRLVVNFARGYLHRGLPFDDLIAEGNLGLIRAVEGYDRHAGVRFSTYAKFWIKQSIRNAVINQGRPIRVPHFAVTLMSKWRRMSAVLAERLGRSPTMEEVRKALGLTPRRLSLVVQALEVNLLTWRPDGLSGNEDENIALTTVVDPHGHGGEDQLIELEELQRIATALGRLAKREATILRMRFGFAPYSPMTLNEVGNALGRTRERIRQLEKHALKRLITELDGSRGEQSAGLDEAS